MLEKVTPKEPEYFVTLIPEGLIRAFYETAFSNAEGVEGEGTMKRIGLAVVCSALIASVLAGGSIAGAEESATQEGAAPPESSLLVGCSANFICVYSSTTYNNPYTAIECGVGGAVGMGGNRFSATNRCGNKTNWLRVNGTAIACMNPGGNRPHPGAFNEVFVANEYGAFC